MFWGCKTVRSGTSLLLLGTWSFHGSSGREQVEWCCLQHGRKTRTQQSQDAGRPRQTVARLSLLSRTQLPHVPKNVPSSAASAVPAALYSGPGCPGPGAEEGKDIRSCTERGMAMFPSPEDHRRVCPIRPRKSCTTCSKHNIRPSPRLLQPTCSWATKQPHGRLGAQRCRGGRSGAWQADRPGCSSAGAGCCFAPTVQFCGDSQRVHVSTSPPPWRRRGEREWREEGGEEGGEGERGREREGHDAPTRLEGGAPVSMREIVNLTLRYSSHLPTHLPTTSSNL